MPHLIAGCVLFKIENKKKIIVDQKHDKKKTYEDFVGGLPTDQPRYAVVETRLVLRQDIEYTAKSGAAHD